MNIFKNLFIPLKGKGKERGEKTQKSSNYWVFCPSKCSQELVLCHAKIGSHPDWRQKFHLDLSREWQVCKDLGHHPLPSQEHFHRIWTGSLMGGVNTASGLNSKRQSDDPTTWVPPTLIAGKVSSSLASVWQSYRYLWANKWKISHCFSVSLTLTKGSGERFVTLKWNVFRD